MIEARWALAEPTCDSNRPPGNLLHLGRLVMEAILNIVLQWGIFNFLPYVETVNGRVVEREVMSGEVLELFGLLREVTNLALRPSNKSQDETADQVRGGRASSTLRLRDQPFACVKAIYGVAMVN